jgi:hypothetical protein
MKIVYFDDGHTGSWLSRKYAKALQDGGAEIEVVYLAPQSALPTTDLYENTVPVRMMGIRGRGQFVKRRLAIACLYWRLPTMRADCYIAAGPDALGICRLAAKFHGARSI